MFREEDKEGIFLPPIVIYNHPEKGYICLAKEDIQNNQLIERCLCLRFDKHFLENFADEIGGGSTFNEYVFSRRGNGTSYSYFAMGYGGVYSHSQNNNARWSIHYNGNDRHTINFRAIRDIKKGEEITVKYVTKLKDLWFDPVDDVSINLDDLESSKAKETIPDGKTYYNITKYDW